MKEFFVGLHQPCDAYYIDSCFISINRLRTRRSPFKARRWVLDSGAFTTISRLGYYPDSPKVYAAEIKRWSMSGILLAAAAQDYMCEDFVLKKTGLTVDDHQRLTVERYDQLLEADTGGIYVMPVLQGFESVDYLYCLDKYGDRLKHGAWVGIGSVCRRKANLYTVNSILQGIKRERPDLKLHGFGLSIVALKSKYTRNLLYSSDSMAWCVRARYANRGGNSIADAIAFQNKIINLMNSDKCDVG